MEHIDKMVAANLLKIKAVQLRPDDPFTWASGWKSPIYCDNRKILSYPEIRTSVVDSIVEVIAAHFKEIDIIAGVATGAIALGALVADRLGMPFVYIRPKPKDHGLGAQIEGVMPKGSNILIVEDLISTGMSSLSAADAVVKNGGNVVGMVAVFSYNFDRARKAFENANIELYTLSNYDALLEEAVACNYIDASDLEVLREWRFRPESWGK